MCLCAKYRIPFEKRDTGCRRCDEGRLPGELKKTRVKRGYRRASQSNAEAVRSRIVGHRLLAITQPGKGFAGYDGYWAASQAAKSAAVWKSSRALERFIEEQREARIR